MFIPQTLDVALVAYQLNKHEQWVQVSRNFENALSRNRWTQFWDAILFRANKLVTFDETMHERKLLERFDLGALIVPLEKIIGSVGRQQDFDRNFMPRSEHLKSRWQSVDQAYYTGTTLPLIELLNLDDAYYVVDGHHRVSVARYHGQQYIEARVIEVHAEAWQPSTRRLAETVCIPCA